MRRTARFLSKQDGLIDHVVHSPLLRAVQTAEILSAELGHDGPTEMRHEIAMPPSLSSVIDLATNVPAGTHGVAIVGHEPTLSSVVQRLLGERSYWGGFRTGAIARFDFDRSNPNDQWTFRWQIRPDGSSLIEDPS